MSTQDIAINCRTSSDMIYEHYARWLDPELMHSINEAEEEIIEAKIVKVSENNLKLEQAQKELKQAEDKIKLYEALQESDPDLFVSKVNPEFTQPEENNVSIITENVDADMEKLSEEYGLPVDKIHELLSEAV